MGVEFLAHLPRNSWEHCMTPASRTEGRSNDSAAATDVTNAHPSRLDRLQLSAYQQLWQVDMLILIDVSLLRCRARF